MVLLGHDNIIHIYASQFCSVSCWLYLSWSPKSARNERPMKKVAAQGIHRTVSRWLRNWLTGRPQRVCTGKGKIIGPQLHLERPREVPLCSPLIIYISDLNADVAIKASTSRRWHPTPSQSKLREGSNAHLPKFTYLIYICTAYSRSAVNLTYALVISSCILAVNTIGELMIYPPWIFIYASGYI